MVIEVVCLLDAAACEGKAGVEFSTRRLGNKRSRGGRVAKRSDRGERKNQRGGGTRDNDRTAAHGVIKGKRMSEC